MISVYITNLGKYNEGYLIGKWLKLPATDDIKMWKVVSNIMKEKHPEAYTIIDWEQEEKENLIWMGQMAEEELPF